MFRLPRLIRVAARPSIVISVALANYQAQCDDYNDEMTKLGKTAERLNSYINFEEIRTAFDIDGVKICASKSSSPITESSNQIMLVNTGSVLIEEKCDVIASIWRDQKNRKKWDSSIVAVYPVKGKSGRISTYYAQDNKDYVTEIFELTETVKNQDDIPRILRIFVNIDASKSIGGGWVYERGYQNSILILKPLTEGLTEVIFCIEKDSTSSGVGSFSHVFLTDLKNKALKVKKARLISERTWFEYVGVNQRVRDTVTGAAVGAGTTIGAVVVGGAGLLANAVITEMLKPKEAQKGQWESSSRRKA